MAAPTRKELQDAAKHGIPAVKDGDVVPATGLYRVQQGQRIVPVSKRKAGRNPSSRRSTR